MHIYCTGVGKNRRVSQAFSKGTGFKIVPPAPIRPGSVFMYGCLRGVLPTLRQAQAEGRNWYYVDNGYFRSMRKGDRDGYFRITKNALQHDGTGNFGSTRWQRLELEIKPWRKTGSYIIVCPQMPLFCETWGFDGPKWERETVAELKRHTDRPIHIRRKIWNKVEEGNPPLQEHLKDAWAVVVWTSNVAVDALLAGVPVLCSEACAGYRMGTPDLSMIETPVMPDDREQWAWNLAANQWTLTEMKNGLCWRELKDR